MAPQPPHLHLFLALTLTMPVSLATQVVQQFPPYAIAPKGSSVNITCSSIGSLKGIYLNRDWPDPGSHVIYYADGKEPTVDELFWMRINFSGSQHELTITMYHLQPNDTGVYTCQAIMDNKISGPGTLVVVTDDRANSCQKDWERAFGLPVALAVACFLAGLGLGVVCAVRRTQIKKLCRRSNRPTAIVVYEDMSCSRHNTLSRPNEYQ
ncbi:T-cell antigen CD7 [Loxodonta africana]|uniref:Ig-like domain-containing protein n=1 Tax=Loxodonta africana TaxID=9785 RepID=G3UEH5_LOXAF|nr:T-cell antigen CD7 [Loxodonta africana]XP_049715712.1 T-cell antigen CD7 [Elephas maximus indicus]